MVPGICFYPPHVSAGWKPLFIGRKKLRNGKSNFIAASDKYLYTLRLPCCHFRVRIRLEAVCLVACFRLNQEKLEITPKLGLGQLIKQ